MVICKLGILVRSRLLGSQAWTLLLLLGLMLSCEKVKMPAAGRGGSKGGGQRESIEGIRAAQQIRMLDRGRRDAG